MNSLSTILQRLNQHPALLEHLTLSNLHSFIVHAARAKHDIILAQPSTQPVHIPPQFLPTSIQHFLSNITGIPVIFVPTCWLVVCDLVWSDDYISKTQSNPHQVFAKHGLEKGLSAWPHT